MTEPSRAVFLSYASQDAEAARRICEALRAAAIECWFDQSELRGGDAWDRQIRNQIRDCALFIPIISAHSQARLEGYFRREWKLAADRTHDMAEEKTFLVPVVIDDTSERSASVPDKFREVQWTHLTAGETPPAFVERVSRLLSSEPAHAAAEVRSAPAVAPHTAAAPRHSGPSPAGSRQTQRVMLVIAAVAVIGLCSVAVDKFVRSKRSAPSTSSAPTVQAGAPTQSTIPGKSIAVLPFVDMSEKKDQEFFADGMAEEILDLLAKIPQLSVIGRTSSFQFKGRAEDLRTIGEKLGAAYIVEGSVRKSGSRIRVTAQLIDSKAGVHLWSETYDRDFGDVLTLQDEISTAIASALRVTVGARDARPFHTERSAEAYTLYLKGKVALDKFNANSLLDAQGAFQQALELDPTLLPAAEGLARTWSQRGFDQNDITPIEAWDQAKAAAQKALQIDANSAIAHSVLGDVAAVRDYDWATSEREYHAALALTSNDPEILAYIGQITAGRGNREEGLRRLNASLAIDPLNALNFQLPATVLIFSGDYSGAESALRKCLQINPKIDGAHLLLGVIQLLGRRPEAALREFQAEPNTSDYGLALAYHGLGRKVESDAALARLIKDYSQIWPYGIAFVYAYRGESNKAFDWLEKAYAARDPNLLTALLGEPFLTPLHNDLRWKALLRKMNLPE